MTNQNNLEKFAELVGTLGGEMPQEHEKYNLLLFALGGMAFSILEGATLEEAGLSELLALYEQEFGIELDRPRS
jgi:hypothetical protein